MEVPIYILYNSSLIISRTPEYRLIGVTTVSKMMHQHDKSYLPRDSHIYVLLFILKFIAYVIPYYLMAKIILPHAENLHGIQSCRTTVIQDDKHVTL